MSTKLSKLNLWSAAPSLWSKHFEPYFKPVYRQALEYLEMGEKNLLPAASCGLGPFYSLAIESE